MIVAFKNEFDIKKFNDSFLQSVYINSVIELNSLNLTNDFVSQIFDFENNKFKDMDFIPEETIFWVNEFSDKSEYAKLSKKGRRYYKKTIFKLVCYHMYWLHGEFQTSNSSFQIDRGYKEKMLIKDSNNELQIIESYDWTCLEDLLGYNPEDMNFKFWKIYSYL